MKVVMMGLEVMRNRDLGEGEGGEGGEMVRGSMRW
jgi:hypothetical protein